jgi:pyruvate dehydrogenase E2 component (dihydrolipoamide acetyltransferase)
MAIPVVMPRQGQSVETCIITSWLKKKGDKVAEGDLLFSYETDKAAFDMESPAGGILLDLFFSEGDEVPVLVNVAVIGAEGEETESFRPAASGGSKQAETRSVEKSRVIAAHADEKPGDEKGRRIRISPRARKMAETKGIDINGLAGSGPGGRIIASDIGSLMPGAQMENAGAPAGEEYADYPLTNVRKLISKAMHSSLQNSAQLTLHLSADVRRLSEARKTIKESLASGRQVQDITLNDMICWCVVRVLRKHPGVNSQFLDNKIRTFSSVHLGVAVDTSRGLMVPAIRNADRMDLNKLSQELKKYADYCRKGNIDPELLKSTSASFTVSNLGNYGVEMFTPVINLPQAGILGVCTITNRPADLGNGVFGFIPVMGLSLTFDHRAVDGGPAALFLKEIKTEIENFKL